MAFVQDEPDVEHDGPVTVLWRRRWIVLATFLVCMFAAYGVSKTLDPVYETSARLLVIQPTDTQSFDAVQAAQVTARTYGYLIDSRNLAEQVARRLGDGATTEEVTSAVTFEPIPETQLLTITAEAGSPQRAKAIADTYARVFEAHAARSLQPTTQTTVRLAETAALPEAPSRPRPLLYTLLAGLLGGILGAGLAYARELLDSDIEDSDELEQRFGVPVLARVPRRGSTPAALSAFAETFRMLRVAVAFSDPGRPPRSLVVTSPREGEGKTTTSRQLALAAAEAGQRVIALEADVYRPTLRRALGVHGAPERGQGLTSYLLGQADLEDVIEPTGAPGVGVIASGTAPLSLASLLETDRGRTVIADLERLCDLVVIDCPPIMPRADAAVLAARAGAVLVVLDPAVSNRHVLRDVLRSLRSVRANVVGLVLNRVQTGDGGYSAYLPDAEGARTRAEVGARS
jgi:polysaccharide biosynthesis transport protein